MKQLKKMSYLVLCLLLNNLYASTSQIKISITPTSRDSLLLPLDVFSKVTYKITNKTTLQTLAIRPISGVTQITTGIDACQNPFSLGSGESCFLNLSVDTTQLKSPLLNGPEVCIDQGSSHFECTKPHQKDRMTLVPKRTNGPAACWGGNNFGQLGSTANSGTSNPNNTPVLVQTLNSGVVTITGGASHNCALLTTGGIKCWGWNLSGQLGNTLNSGTNNPNNIPLPVQTLNSGVTAISAGNSHTCAVIPKGAVRCWGSNQFGQIGSTKNSGTSNPNNIPLPVQTLNSGVVAVTSGASHSCALLPKGAVKCWGANRYGQLGNPNNSGTNNPSNIPLPVQILSSGVVAITSGANHNCALLTKGGVQCWGNNSFGQLGNATNSGSNNPNNSPLPVQLLSSGVVSIKAGANHTCALLTTGAVRCWGSNRYGQLGSTVNSGTASANNIPLPVQTLTSGVRSITGGSYHTCALLLKDGIKCWGLNQTGQLGNPKNSGSANPNNMPLAVQILTSNVLNLFNNNLGHSSCVVL